MTSRSSIVAWSIVALTIASIGTAYSQADSAQTRPALLTSPTFSHDIAPIIFKRCSPCHRPDQVAPFNLLNYSDVKKRTAQIAEVTSKRIMPPWPPAANYGHFEAERRLTENELGVLQQWIVEGAIEGNPADLPPSPSWPDGWFLGKPDLVVSMPKPFALAAEGRDAYRNFVVAIPTTERRYVRAVELRPGNARIVHHAFMFLDQTGQSRRLDGKEAQPGAPYGTQMPAGQFLSYQPGRMPAMAPDGLAWTLEKGSYLVLQAHLKPTGKPELLQASVGFYFTDHAPTNTPFKVGLTSYTIDIPAGNSNYVVKDSFVLPVDVSAVAVLPHAHYLAREMKGFASLPDGGTIPLIHIKNWDFEWQGAYRYAQPVLLPKGSTLSMEFTYDNSTNNARNPNQPPQAVIYGEQSSDEMAELWLQLLTRNADDRALLNREYALKNDRVFYERSQFLLKKSPNDPKGHFTLAVLLLNQKKTAEALRHFKLALEAKPDYQEAYFTLGVVHLMNNNLTGAEDAFRNAIRIDPEDYRAHGSLGNVFLRMGRMEDAALQFQNALRINPNDATAQENLEMIWQAMEKRKKQK
ncbi:MAG: tetratricopeptide repeat protein [Verrucomicrobia bacterium]|nr:tetratricopeptide repeat protein [Verrucomicrobiota bacterium]